MKENRNITEDQQTQIISKKKISKKMKQKKDAPKKEPINIQLYDYSEFYIPMHRIDVFASQILGSRKTQQDMFAVSPKSDDFSNDVPTAWAVVCDGMGGMASGELASKAATDVMSQILQSTPLDKNIPEILKQAVTIANEEVKKISMQKSEITGTTLVCVVINGNSLYYASVGDSRIYLCRGNEIVQITRDHNYLMELDAMVEAGQISEDDALASPQREALISYIGIEELTLADISSESIKLQNDDIIILCSDGLTKILSDRAILDITRNNSSDIRLAVQTLLDEVQLDPIRKLDNTTIAVLKYINN